MCKLPEILMASTFNAFASLETDILKGWLANLLDLNEAVSVY